MQSKYIKRHLGAWRTFHIWYIIINMTNLEVYIINELLNTFVQQYDKCALWSLGGTGVSLSGITIFEIYFLTFRFWSHKRGLNSNRDPTWYESIWRVNSCKSDIHYNDVICAPWLPNSPEPELFIQQRVQSSNKENITYSHYWPFANGIQCWRKASWRHTDSTDWIVSYKSLWNVCPTDGSIGISESQRVVWI